MMPVNARIPLSISRCSSQSTCVEFSTFFMFDLVIPDLFCCRGDDEEIERFNACNTVGNCAAD